MTEIKTKWMWRACTDRLDAILVECPDGLYPNNDAEGYKIFENTHFETESEAWKKLLAETEAGVSLAGSRMIEVEKYLRDAQIRAGIAAMKWREVRDKFDDSRVK